MKKISISEELKENDIYSVEGVELYTEDDAISNVEEGFMMGYLAA